MEKRVKNQRKAQREGNECRKHKMKINKRVIDEKKESKKIWS